MFRSAFASLCLAWMLAACTNPPRATDSPMPAGFPVPANAGDPLNLTRARLTRIRGFLLDAASTGAELPSSLEQALPSGLAPRSRSEMVRDGWDRPLRYRRFQGDFEVRSAGPDGRFDTGDDMVATRSTSPAPPEQ